ncbi:T9SS type A sorting domain-containing protein [bacterium]|nr:T9SS type A sorting domain-containing protein [bacterium]
MKCFSQTFYYSYPDWISEPLQHRSTGLGIADINQDGWDDIIIANGNDMERQNLCVYYNNGDGGFPTFPSWSSGDQDYHGHLSVGDINGDRLPDVAVSVFLGIDRFNEPGYVKVYYNIGTKLESFPSFRSADSMFTFSCALGDADGDGDLDLAVACGQPFGSNPNKTYSRVYYNNGNTIDTLPAWRSEELMSAMDVEFADMDRNGYLDLIFANNFGPNYIHLADDKGNICTSHSWASGDNDYYSNSIAIAHFTDDDYFDIVISSNHIHSGRGKFKIYEFDAAPIGQSSPDWCSSQYNYGSAIHAEDIDHNGYTDLFTGCWWSNVQLFLGNTDGLPYVPDWQSETYSVIEAYDLRDLDRDCIINISDTVMIITDSIHVFCLSHTNIEEINSISINDQIQFSDSEFCSVPGKSWISVKPVLKKGDSLFINYSISKCRDLIVSNWDENVGNYIFYYHQLPIKIFTYKSVSELNINVYPNPLNDKCKFKIESPVSSKTEIFIYDINGRIVQIIDDNFFYNGESIFTWEGKNNNGAAVSSGIYLYTVKYSNNYLSGKVLLIK